MDIGYIRRLIISALELKCFIGTYQTKKQTKFKRRKSSASDDLFIIHGENNEISLFSPFKY